MSHQWRSFDCRRGAGLCTGMRPVAHLARLPIGGDHPLRLMAAINVSPESFFAASVRIDDGALRESAQRAVAEGADLIDIGAKSTAPYLDTAIPLEEEVRRMTRAVQVVTAAVRVPVCADTTRAGIAYLGDHTDCSDRLMWGIQQKLVFGGDFEILKTVGIARWSGLVEMCPTVADRQAELRRDAFRELAADVGLHDRRIGSGLQVRDRGQ